MAIDKQTLAAANKYTKKTVEGAGAIKGKNCTIYSIIPMPTIHETEVTFAWYEDGASLPTLSKMMVPDGAQGPQGEQGETGLGIKSLNIDSNRHLIVTYDDDTTQDAGLIPGGGGPGEIDTELDPTSTNAVENRAIAIPIAALQASMLTKAEQSDISRIDLSISQLQGSLLNKAEKTDISRIDLSISQLQGSLLTKAEQTDISRIDLSISQLQGSLLNKVNKETGKGLSTNDFSDTYKDKLEALLGIKSAGAGLNFDPSTGELTATGTSIEIDTELDPTSVHPVQNKAIAIPIQALQGSMLTKANQLDITRIDLDIAQLQGSLLTKAEQTDINRIDLSISQLQGSLLTKAEQTDISRIDLSISQLQGSLLNKVNKETGKGLSTNDFSDTYKDKLEALLGIKSAGAGLNFDPATGELTATGTSIEIDTELDPTSVHPVQNKAIAIPIQALQGSVLTKANQSDISRIDLSISQLQGSLLNKASKSELPTKVSELTNDSNYQTASDVATAISGKAEQSDISRIDLDIAQLQGSLLTKAEQTDISRIDLSISQLQGSLLNKASKSELPTKVSELTNDEGFIDSSALPTKVSDLTNDEGFIDSSALPTKVSELTNDSNYQTASDVTIAISGKADRATTLSGYGITDAVSNSQIGSANGVAELGSDGKVPAAQLPSYVDDVEEYATALSFPTTGESGKIYVALDTNKIYRWSGSNYVVVGGDLALGETSSTAYAGNKGKANADAIAAIKDSSSIDSFADVENALSGKQATISDLSTIRSGAAAGATAYQKPSTGIPKKDLDSAVQTSLGKADTALQSLALGETSSTAYAGNKGKANADAIAAIKDGSSIDSFADVESALGGKENTISDLATIRSGAAAGATAYQKPSTGIPKTDLASAVQTSLGKADTAYQKPSTGIPKTDLASAVQTSLGKADTAYQKPSTGIPKTDLDSAVQTSLGKADTALQSHQSLANYYQKPSTGIPKTDLASAVQTSLGKADTALQSHQSLANYYQTGDTAETALADGDYIPFYDASAKAKRKTLWSNIKAVLKSYFDSLYTSTAVKGDSESTYRTGNVNLTKANIGLGNVGNFKAVSTVASQGLTDTEKSNARTNIGAGTSSSDTKNTAGTTNSTSKLFLAGATSQAANPQTYSNVNCYAQNGALYSNGLQVATDNWTSTATVQSDMTVTFSGLNDNYGYDLYCQNKLVGVSAMTKTGSGTSVTLKFTLTGAAQGDTCKLRIIRN